MNIDGSWRTMIGREMKGQQNPAGLDATQIWGEPAARHKDASLWLLIRRPRARSVADRVEIHCAKHVLVASS